ncbi:universal stress protein [Caldisericum exile]|uniref:UspA family protein n=1 Tax=Caldisericum exile (strain DSM 21853 / NBRC 104410 / AZM16c01) TaxID=511051 RepID=A0A7U6GEP6_CALEA|nr:universal stress protein [Caldisericum exile]BAL80995.1 UspA family protein [Caldisericum exile AZM16c01]
MYKKILILVDNSQVMSKVVEYTYSLFPEATLYLLSVINLGPFAGYYTKTVFREMKSLAEETLNRLELLLEEKKGKFQTEVLEGEPVNVLLSYAKKKNIDLIVLQTHAGLSVNKIKIGSTTYKLLINSHVPVLLLNEDIEVKNSPKILHPTSGSKYSEIATVEVGKLASYWDSEVEALILREPKEKIAERVRELLRNFHVESTITYADESEINSILKRAPFSDIIIGSRGSPRPSYKLHNIFKPFSLDPTLKLLVAFLPKPLLLICD